MELFLDGDDEVDVVDGVPILDVVGGGVRGVSSMDVIVEGVAEDFIEALGRCQTAASGGSW